MHYLCIFALVCLASFHSTDANARFLRQVSVVGNACPDANTNVCRSCSCSPTTARYVKNGDSLIAPVGGLPPSSNSVCDQCCFQQLIVTPQCPIDVATNQPRPALQASPAFNLQQITQTQSYVGCCPFTPCQSGYSCMFDNSNAVWLCCGVGGVAPPVVDTCRSGIPANGQCNNGACGVGFACELTVTGRQVCCPGAPTFPTIPPTQPPVVTDGWGCANSNALVYRTPQGVVPQPAVPVVGCLELGAIRCPTGTTCQAHNRPVTAAWKAGICCVPRGVDQSTIPILLE